MPRDLLPGADIQVKRVVLTKLRTCLLRLLPLLLLPLLWLLLRRRLLVLLLLLLLQVRLLGLGLAL